MSYTEKQLQKNKITMQKGASVPVELVEFEGKRSTGEVRLQEFTQSESQSRAIKFLLVCVGLAFVCAIIPPHILWFFGFLTMGAVGYFLRKNERQTVLGGNARCPKCGNFQILGKSSAEFPILHYCSECRSRCDIYKEGEVPQNLH